jgi:CubicO group peptidase (beta-lactamase class C family)
MKMRWMGLLGVMFFLVMSYVGLWGVIGAETVVAGVATAPTVPAAAADRRARSVDRLFQEFINDESPGAAAIVIHEDKVLYRAGFGLADMDQGTPITPGHIFHLGSVGKQFTALAVMILAERGLLDYDDPVADYLPELAHFGNRFTIRHLLHHTSGLPDIYEDEDLYDELLSRADNPTATDLLAVVAAERRLVSAPGRTHAYSNTGYDLLGLLIERVSGQSYARFLAQNVFTPLGMERTFSAPLRTSAQNRWVVHSYTLDEDDELVAYNSDPLDNLLGSGSVYASVDDLYHYDQALFGGKLVRPSTLEEAFQPARLNNRRSVGYGFGWELGPASERIVYHSGTWLAFQSCYLRYLSDELSVIVLFNQDYDETDVCELAFEIAEIYQP